MKQSEKKVHLINENEERVGIPRVSLYTSSDICTRRMFRLKILSKLLANYIPEIDDIRMDEFH